MIIGKVVMILSGEFFVPLTRDLICETALFVLIEKYYEVLVAWLVTSELTYFTWEACSQDTNTKT